MTTLSLIIEALPVSGFKPAAPFKPRGPAKPALPAQQKAQVMTPKGRVTTVKKPSTMRKPGYRFIKYTTTPGAKPDKHGPSDKFARKSKHATKPIGTGTLVKEMKTLTQLIPESHYLQTTYEDDDGNIEVSIEIASHGGKYDSSVWARDRHGKVLDQKDFNDTNHVKHAEYYFRELRSKYKTNKKMI